MEGGVPAAIPMPLLVGTKFSAIAPAPAPPASTDVLMGVQAPSTAPVDYLYTVAQVATALGVGSVTVGAPVSGGTPTEVLYVGAGNVVAGASQFTIDSSGRPVIPPAGAYMEAASTVTGGVTTGPASFVVLGGIAGDSYFNHGAGNFTLTGNNNIGTGGASCGSLTTGSVNAGWGVGSLKSVTTGSHNTGFSGALRALIDGNINLGMGDSALAADQHSSQNLAIGDSCLGQFNSSGATNNLAIGYIAGFDLLDGTTNLIIGQNTARGLVHASNNVILGHLISGLPPTLGGHFLLSVYNGQIILDVDVVAGLATFGNGIGLAFSASDALNGTKDLFLYRDAANVLAQRNGTNAQTFEIYNTFINGSNWERGALTWLGNTLFLASDHAGTGVGRSIVIQASGTQAVLTQMGDAYGASSLTLANSGAVAGGLFRNSGLDLFDMSFQGSSNAIANVRFEHRGSFAWFYTGNTGGEFQFGAANNPGLVEGNVANVSRVPMIISPVAFASLPTPVEGMCASVTDSTVNTFGSVIAGGGGFHVPAYYNGTNWVVG